MRDIVLGSLRCQFATKVERVLLRNGVSADGPALEAFLRDLANNVTQALATEEDS